MEQKIMGWKTRGMNQDLSVSAFNNEFSFENMNLRLSTNEGNTQMSWVNEKGTKLMTLDIENSLSISEEHDTSIGGIPIGAAILNHKLVLFTTMHPSKGFGKPDFIYVLEYSDSQQTTLKGKLLYNGNLNFNSNYPLETLVSYEAEHIQKVYWTDGFNQPRMINIAASDSKLKKWNSTTDGSVDTFFDFVPSFSNNEEVIITQNTTSGGIFAPGVIQYAFTYINKYGQESNLVYVSPLYYLSHYDRGASPEGVGADERVTSSFRIELHNLDDNFDYVRLYSIQRTSLDLEPFAKHLDDLPISGTTNAELFSREIIYSSDADLTLPVDAKGKILTAEVRNGSYSVTVNPMSGTTPINNSESFSFVGFKHVNSNRIEGEILSLQELINMVYLRSGYDDVKVAGTYYSGILFNSSLALMFSDLASRNNYDNWEFKAGNVTLSSSQLTGAKIVYSYKTKKWYITTGDATEEEIQNPIEGGNYITYVDNGTTGSTIDPTVLLYVGGREITVLTMADKDGTLFMGNLEQKNALVTNLQEYFDNIRGSEDEIDITFKNDDGKKKLDFSFPTGIYSYTHELHQNQQEISTFKGGETYRFGFQLQKKDGEWTEPIFIKDKKNPLYPNTSLGSMTVGLTYAQATIDFPSMAADNGLDFDFSIYQKIRPVIVYPGIGDRNILCQGVINPTVFNAEDRISNSPYAQASWYFRPYMNTSVTEDGSDSSNPFAGKVEVTSHSKDGSESYEPSAAFIGSTTNVCVLVTSIDSHIIDTVLSRGYLEYFEDKIVEKAYKNPRNVEILEHIDGETERHYFQGIIFVGDGKYIFISDEKWPDEKFIKKDTQDFGDYVITTMWTRKYSNTITKVQVSDAGTSFKIYSGLKKTDNNFYFYTKTSDTPDDYVFKFYVHLGDVYTDYIVTFHTTAEGIDFVPMTYNSSGNEIAYSHYKSLECQDVNDNYKAVEIQGSKQIYADPFRPKDDNASQASQFFVDQSIVTLNSPDLEFDTEVQGYSTEGLKLRIIGAIPITANASSHKIIASARLESNHNVKNATTHKIGRGELSTNVIHNNIDIFGGKRLVAEYLWHDVLVKRDEEASNDNDDKIITSGSSHNFLIYPWNKIGSLNNDIRKESVGSSWLKTKKMSNILYSLETEYFADQKQEFENVGMQIHLTENEFIKNYRLPRQKSTSSEINYYPNIDRIITVSEEYDIKVAEVNSEEGYSLKSSSPVSMKYKSTTHAVIALDADDAMDRSSLIPIMPYAKYFDKENVGYYDLQPNPSTTFWGDTEMNFDQSYINMSTVFGGAPYNFLWLGELYKDVIDETRFGGNTKEALRNNKWLIGGDAIPFNADDTITLSWTKGDTYYQRYDCLKTYAFTPEDINQIVEILSFMCETHVNIDGRYDRNRGQIDNTDMHPTIFNLLNPVYSQKDNFFTSRQLDMEDVKELKYPNQIYYTKTKNSGADVDMWTNVTLANTLELDGDKGKISSLNRFNDAIIAFQDTGISQVLYNENTQISTTQGVPIEIANSGKVQGKRYLSDTIGCSNKWSISQTPAGLYFMDNHSKGIYLFNGQLQNLSLTGGFNAWCKQNIPLPGTIWSPRSFNDFTSHYDKKNQEVLFVNGNTALAYSEKFGAFTSFYSYENTPYFCNLDDTGLFIMFNDYKVPYGSGMHRKFRNLSMSTIWQHQTGEYCKFFNSDAPYWMTLVGNPEPQRDKVFTNLEFRATVDGDGKEVVTGSQQTKTGFEFYLPFDSLEVWNEYQHGVTALKNMKGHAAMMHHTPDKESSMKRKYRIWRCDVPRDNAPLTSDEGKNISRFKVKPLDRMRNPWVYLKLQKDTTSADSGLPRVEIHDMMMKYFV